MKSFGLRIAKRLYFNSDDEGYHNIYEVDASTGKMQKITENSTNTELTITPDGEVSCFPSPVGNTSERHL